MGALAMNERISYRATKWQSVGEQEDCAKIHDTFFIRIIPSVVRGFPESCK